MRILWILLYLLRLLVGEEETPQQVVGGERVEGKKTKLGGDEKELFMYCIRFYDTFAIFHLYFVCYTIFTSLVDSPFLSTDTFSAIL